MGIFGVVTTLLMAIALAAETRLNHPARDRIYRHLLLLPGDHFRSIARFVKLGVGNARHHLSVLVREGLVSLDAHKGRARYYAEGDLSQPQKNQIYREHWKYRDLRAKVFHALRRSGRSGPSGIAQILRISRQLAAYHLARLQDAGSVTRADGEYRLR